MFVICRRREGARHEISYLGKKSQNRRPKNRDFLHGTLSPSKVTVTCHKIASLPHDRASTCGSCSCCAASVPLSLFWAITMDQHVLPQSMHACLALWGAAVAAAAAGAAPAPAEWLLLLSRTAQRIAMLLVRLTHCDAQAGRACALHRQPLRPPGAVVDRRRVRRTNNGAGSVGKKDCACQRATPQANTRGRKNTGNFSAGGSAPAGTPGVV